METNSTCSRVRKIVVLHSGGMDSAVCLGIAVSQYGADNVLALTFDYGQRHSNELICARRLAKHYKVKHIVKDVSSIFSSITSDLTNYNKDIPTNTEVSFRNGIFVSIAAGIAHSLYPKTEVDICLGTHEEDFMVHGYGDCAYTFIKQMSLATLIGTGSKVNLIVPLQFLSKSQVLSLGLTNNVPFELTWSCYTGGEKPCGKCATCIDRLNAFKKLGMQDPLEYEGGVK